jgi:hypothetical protein
MAWEIAGNSGTNRTANFLGTTDNQPLVIRTNGAERLRVDPSGSVGIAAIGTITQKYTLTVNGNSTIGKAQSSAGAASALVYDEGSGYVGFQKRGTTQTGNMGLGNNASEILSTSGNLGLFTVGSGYLALGTNTSERLRVDTNGNVGIGTTSPKDTLTVDGNSTIGKAQSATGVAYAVAYDEGSGYVGFQKRGTTQSGNMGLGNNASEILSTSGNLGLFTVGSGYLALGTLGSECLRVDTKGNIGIGTTTPNSKLHVFGDVTVTGDVLLAGADCAEHFDLAGKQPLEPGTVVVIDEEGAVRESRDAYGKNVAGVISGAGEYRHAIVLVKRPSVKYRVPVALLGKVYCKVDSDYSPVQVGDLLTTSPTY